MARLIAIKVLTVENNSQDILVHGVASMNPGPHRFKVKGIETRGSGLIGLPAASVIKISRVAVKRSGSAVGSRQSGECNLGIKNSELYSDGGGAPHGGGGVPPTNTLPKSEIVSKN